MAEKKLKFIDLFCGIGGFRIGLERAGMQNVLSCDIDEACRKTYFDNFGVIPESDIQEINISKIPDFDVLAAGFPCQPFSISGKKNGFNDTRGTLFFEILKIIKVKSPKVVILENVKHYVHHDKKKTLKVTLDSLKQLGYKISFSVLNAKNYGVPQNRERLIIIGSKYDYFDFSRLKTKEINPLRNFLEDRLDYQYLDKSEYTLIEKPVLQSSGLIFVGYRNKNMHKNGIRPNTEHLSRVHRQPNRIYSIDGLHPTIPSQETSGRFFIYIPELDKVRKLSVKECYKLMGFPEDYVMHKTSVHKYKQIGNSICIPMVEEIGKQILKQKIYVNEPQREIRRDLSSLGFNY